MPAFGTDGLRGRANTELTPELALSLGRALVTLLREEGTSRPAVVIARDPRWSGEMLEAALVAGITSAGGDSIGLGVLPTPAVAHLTPRSSAAAGVVISASHNPMDDNGIKVFGADGFKLSDEEEARLSELLDHDGPRPGGTDVGRHFTDSSAASRYVDHLVEAADTDLAGLRLVVDAANGAASEVGPEVYRRLGAEVVTLNCEPDGANINRGGGSLHPEVVCRVVTERGCDVGISHDGDADRLIAATHRGREVDGDVILAVLARAMHGAGTLRGGAVATTVMTNLGFRQAMDRLGIEVVETPVGDRHVLAAMREQGLNLGGEQSGHLISLDHATTGDGILSAVRLLSVVRSSGTTLEELTGVMTRLPQVLENVPVPDRSRLAEADGVWEAVAAEERRLGDAGRVLVRPSGTEPVVRVMVEAPTGEDARATADRIATAVERSLA